MTGARPNKKVLALFGGVTVVAAQLNAFKRFERLDRVSATPADLAAAAATHDLRIP